MPIDPAILTVRLDEARDAYHALVTGTKARVIVDQNGERVEFTAAKRADLAIYISELERALAAPTPFPNNGPIRFIF